MTGETRTDRASQHTANRLFLTTDGVAILSVILVFVISRLLYYQAGIRFESGSLYELWQFIYPDLLTQDLWRSIFHLYGQPPLMNLITGLVLILFPQGYAILFQAAFLFSGLVLAVSLYLLGRQIGLPAAYTAILAGLFIVSPAAVLYENWMFYTYPVATLLCLAALCLRAFLQTASVRAGAAFFLLLAAACLTWSLFHLAWMAVILAFLLFHKAGRKKALLAGSIPLLLVTAWYAKNALAMGSFTSSSWMGMNLARMTTSRVPFEERRALVRQKQLSRFALYEPFSVPRVYLRLLPGTSKTGVPLLDREENPNGSMSRHHIVYVEASRHYLQDALYMVRNQPFTYLSSTQRALYCFFHSASDYDFLEDNSSRIAGIVGQWNKVFYGQMQRGERIEEYFEPGASYQASRVAWLIVLAFLLAAPGAGLFLLKRWRALPEPERLLLLFMWWTVVFVSLTANLLELGENNRFRFVVDPFLLLLASKTVLWLVEGIKEQRGKSQA